MKTNAIEPDFDKADGLVPAIVQDADTSEVLMMAWMNRESFELTRSEGIAVYWSRSREKIWRKGESSGNTQKIREILIDCDADTILIKVEQIGGAACHTGRRSCFYTRYTPSGTEIISDPLFDPEDVYGSK